MNSFIDQCKAAFNDYQRPIICSVIQWFLMTLFQWDRWYFNYTVENRYLIIAKILFLFTLLAIWIGIAYVLREYKKCNPIVRRGIFIFSMYFTILALLLLVLWPGTWNWDDIWVLFAIRQYHLNAWQHVLTSMYQMVLLQLLPFPGGIILLQNLLITVIVSYSVVQLELHVFRKPFFNNQFLDTFLKIVPFLLPPVLMYQYSGYRIGIYVYLEFLMLVILITTYKDRIQWSYKKALFVCALASLVCTWRSEALLYLPALCIVILVFYRKFMGKKMAIFCLVALLIGFGGIQHWQKASLGNSNYEIISTARQVAVLVRYSDQSADQQELLTIGKVVDLKAILDNPKLNGEALYWDKKFVKKNYSKQEYHDYLKSIVKLTLKYPSVVFNERMDLFYHGAIVPGVDNTATARLFDPKSNNRAGVQFKNANWMANKPVLQNKRKKLINTVADANHHKRHTVIWSCLVPFMALAAVVFYFIKKRNWLIVILTGAIWAKVGVVILTAPSGWLMYYLSFYFLGYILLVYSILYFIKQRREKRGIVEHE